MPISKNKRTTHKRLKKKKRTQPKEMPPYLVNSYRSTYIGVGISFVVIGLFLLFLGDGTDEEFGISIVLMFIGVIAALFGKLASPKELKKSTKGLSKSDIDVF